jgi:hypothetical protein
MGWPPRFRVAFSRRRAVHSHAGGLRDSEHHAARRDATRRGAVSRRIVDTAYGHDALRATPPASAGRRGTRRSNTAVDTVCQCECCLLLLSAAPPLWARSTRCAVPEPVPRPPARSGWRAVAASSRILTTSRGILGHNLTASCGFTTAGAVGCQCTRPRSQHRSKPHGLADTAKQMRSSDQGRLQSR